MQFTKKLGVVIEKKELDAALKFAGESSCLYIKIDRRKLLAWSSQGHASIYHRGEAFDGAGKGYDGYHTWQVAVSALEPLRRLMQEGQELILCTNEAGRMTRYKVRSIGSSQKINSGSLDGNVAEQLDLNLPKLLPMDPPLRLHMALAADQMVWSPHYLKLLDIVGKACGKGAVARFCIPEDSESVTHVQIDTRQNFIDSNEPRWTVLLPAASLEERRKAEPAESLELFGSRPAQEKTVIPLMNDDEETEGDEAEDEDTEDLEDDADENDEYETDKGEPEPEELDDEPIIEGEDSIPLDKLRLPGVDEVEL